MSIMGAAVAGCSHPTSSAPPAAAARATGPLKPAATADDNAWRTYLSEQGKVHGKDVQGHPYIYLIPGGESAAATAQRKNEVQSVAFAVGPIVISGSLLVMGGPDAQQTNQFAMTLSKTLKAHVLRGVVVLIVSDATQEKALTKAFEPTDAALRVVTM
ncbi:hypothetical protein [Rhodanobacter umsongensis]|uniref:hypothetical protein n=1 Tax=Rhodanobacter umsongensis TaxID=633153 RepID=UPI00366E87C9